MNALMQSLKLRGLPTITLFLFLFRNCKFLNCYESQRKYTIFRTSDMPRLQNGHVTPHRLQTTKLEGEETIHKALF